MAAELTETKAALQKAMEGLDTAGTALTEAIPSPSSPEQTAGTQSGKGETPVWMPVSAGGYTTAILDGWTGTVKTGEPDSLMYFYYGTNIVMVSVSPTEDIPDSFFEDSVIEETYGNILESLTEGDMNPVSRKTVTLEGRKAMLAQFDFSGSPVEILLYHAPGGNGIFTFVYAQDDDHDALREEIMDLVLTYTTCTDNAVGIAGF